MRPRDPLRCPTPATVDAWSARATGSLASGGSSQQSDRPPGRPRAKRQPPQPTSRPRRRPRDNPPNGLLSFTGTNSSIEALHLDLAGTATDDVGVKAVRVALEDEDTRRYVQPNGTMAAAFATLPATLASPTEGTAFTEARIFVSGRALDDVGLSEVAVAIVNSAGQ
jgi:hypothetical protein